MLWIFLTKNPLAAVTINIPQPPRDAANAVIVSKESRR